MEVRRRDVSQSANVCAILHWVGSLKLTNNELLRIVCVEVERRSGVQDGVELSVLDDLVKGSGGTDVFDDHVGELGIIEELDEVFALVGALHSSRWERERQHSAHK